MKKAAEAGDYQWAMELADLVMRLGTHREEAKVVKATSLRALADQQINACSRNYYLTYAKELMAKPATKE
jgi:alkyl sulfatase BDS1-like metallo-beta-lactamase superfamily hydrolase